MPRLGSDRPDMQAGFFANALGLLAVVAKYLRARLQLAGLEAKEAAIHFGILIGLLIVALIVSIFGYIFLCFGLAFGIAALIGGEHAFIWTTFGLAVLHLGGAVACLIVVKARIGSPVFTATMDEFRKDQEWLSNESRS